MSGSVTDYYWCESCSGSFHESESMIGEESIEGVTVRHIQCPSCGEGEGLEPAYPCEQCGDFYAPHLIDDGTCLTCADQDADRGEFHMWLVRAHADEIGVKVQNDERGKGPRTVLSMGPDAAVHGSHVAGKIIRALIDEQHMPKDNAIAVRAGGEDLQWWVGWYTK